MELTDGQKKAIVSMFAHGASVRDLVQWYGVDQETIREVLRPHVQLVAPSSGRGRTLSG